MLRGTLVSILFALLACGQTVVDVPKSPVPIQILAQSPAETHTDLQIICLFRSAPENTLHGSLEETNAKLHGLLNSVRKKELFRGELGETMLLAPPQNSLGAKKLLIIGLGDSQTFSLERMQLVGEIVYTEAGRLRIAHPFFAPTILDGGVNRFTTGQVSEQVIAGFLRAAAVQMALENSGASPGPGAATLTFLAGPKNVMSTLDGIQKAITGSTALH
jgi:hypothetical protein